tara:strand:+ start:484 stop:651 length:168 start_codon:yes stop_codon:yes gene_type:complete
VVLLAATGRTLVLVAIRAFLGTFGTALGSALFLAAISAEFGFGFGTTRCGEGEAY